MENKYQIGQKVICIGKRCMIVATKNEPKEFNNNPYFKEVKMPEKDYFLYIFDKLVNGEEHYLGTLDVYESQIESIW